MITIPPLPNESVQNLVLKDGRTLSYAEYGDLNGTPILFFHGTPGTHYLIKMAEEGARKAGFRLIAPDRPGLGDATMQEGRALFHYPLDITQLLDHLGIATIGVMGISGGAPYAFQCAHDLSNRITYVVSLSGWVSYGREGMRRLKIDPLFRVVGWSSRKFPALAALVAKSARYSVRNRLSKLYKHMLKKLPPSDVSLLEDEDVRNIFLSDLQNAFRQSWKGVARDSALQFSTPAYELSAIQQPVVIMHGTADSVVPYSFAEYMQARLPNLIEMITVDDGGHLCAMLVQEDIFEKCRALESAGSAS